MIQTCLHVFEHKKEPDIQTGTDNHTKTSIYNEPFTVRLNYRNEWESKFLSNRNGLVWHIQFHDTQRYWCWDV